MATLSPWLDQKFYLADGVTPNAGGLVFTYEPGTTTKKTTYTEDSVSQNTNPIVLNSAGECNLWLGAGGYKIVNAPANDTDPPAAAIKTWDNVNINGSNAQSHGTVDTIAQLKGLDEGEYETVQVLGYYGADGAGAGLFYWDATSTESDNGGTVIAPTISDGTGRWRRPYTGVINVMDFGATIGGVFNNRTIFETCVSAAYASNCSIFIPGGQYYLDHWNLNALTLGLSISGAGPSTELLFGSASGYGFRIDGGCRKIVMKDLTLNFQSAAAQDCFQLGTSSASSQAYECAFHNLIITGNASSNVQRGLVITNAYINQFYNCLILSFGINVRFNTEANSNNFYGCSIRANQTYNLRLIDAVSGQENTFYGGDIENAGAWIENTACLGLVFDGVYMEASLNVAIVLTGGKTYFHKCFISEARVTIAAAGHSSWISNRILKTGTSYFMYLISSTCPNLYILGNFVEYTNAATQGLFIRGFSTGLQYFDTGLSAPVGNIVTYGNLYINQERVYDINTSTYKHLILSRIDGLWLNGPIDANSGQSRFSSVSLTQTTGTAPMTVVSTTAVTNLNADMVDGNHASAFANKSTLSTTVTAGSGWYRVAVNGTVSVGGTGHNRAGAIFDIYDSTGGQHAICRVYAGILFGNQPTLLLLSSHAYTSARLGRVRLVYNPTPGTAEGAALDLEITGGSSEDIKVVMLENEGTTGWSLDTLPAATIPGGSYTSMELNIATGTPVIALSADGLANIFQLRRDGRVASAQVPTATVPAQRYRTHYKIAGVSLNSAATDTGTFTGLPSKYRILRLTVFDASISLTTATFDLRTAAAGAGTAIVSAYAPTGCTAASKTVDATLAAVAGTDYETSGTLYLRNVTAQGSAATASFLLEIQVID